MSATLLSARVVAHPFARRELLLALVDWTISVRRSAGVLASGVYEDIEEPGVFGLDVEWESSSAFEAHVRSEAFGALLGALDLLAKPVRMTVSRVADEYGKDALPVIRRLRESGRGGAQSPGAA